MGPRHSGVITEDGSLYTFGSGNYGILGHGDEKDVKHTQPKLVEYFKANNLKVKKVCMGDFFTIALTEDGGVYTWGFGGKKGFLGILFRGK
jgi:alpha-tubulin suppressor-like RCC1 family protein